jgi:hypothetical protein
MKIRLLLITLLLLSVVLAACQPQGAPVPQDPLEAVKTIADKQEEVKTQHVELKMDLNLKLDGLSGDAAQAAALFKNFKAQLNLSGDVDNTTENFTMKGDVDLGPLTAFLAQGEEKVLFELVKVGDKMYTKANVGDTANTWSEQDMPKTENQDENPLNPDMVMGLLKKSSKAEKLADEKVGDVDTLHYKVTLSPETLLDSISTLASATGGMSEVDQTQLDEAKKVLKDSTLEVELWAGKEDLLIRKALVRFNMNLKDIPDQPGASAQIDFTLEDTISKINQPVTITVPE